MKKVISIFVLSLFIFSCSVKKKPIFLKIDDVKILSFKTDTIRLQANAFFKNENDIGGKISTEEIKVIVNGTEVAQVSSNEFKVPANKEFAVPLKVVIPASRIFDKNKGGILGGLLSSVLNQAIKLQFKGDIRYKVFGVSSVYPVDTTKELKIKF